jgi:hypothetical protein
MVVPEAAQGRDFHYTRLSTTVARSEQEQKGAAMFGFVERVIVPSVVIFVLVGGVAGAVLGFALVWRSDRALAFVTRMNRWVSTRRALDVLEAPHEMRSPSPRLRRWLGAFLVFGGAFAAVLLLMRLNFDRAAYVPGVDLRRWLVSGVSLQAMKWVFVVGCAFSLAVGVLMLFFPARLAAFEARMNRWYSSSRLLAADEAMHMPLEPRVEAHPRAAGWLIAFASLVVAAAMVVLIVAKLRY